MFLVEEKRSPDRQATAAIYMRPDGLFEGHIYRADSVSAGEPDNYEVCGVTETLPRLEAIVDEELGL